MALARAGGYENYATNSSNLIAELYAKKLVAKFYKTTVFGAIANVDYEGIIANMGDTVHIRQTPDITISVRDRPNGATLRSPNEAT